MREGDSAEFAYSFPCMRQQHQAQHTESKIIDAPCGLAFPQSDPRLIELLPLVPLHLEQRQVFLM